MRQKIVVVGMPLPRSGRVRGWVHMDVRAFASGGSRALSPAAVALGDAALTELAPRAVKPALRGTHARVVIAADRAPAEIVAQWARARPWEFVSPARLADRLIELEHRPQRPQVAVAADVGSPPASLVPTS